MKRSLKRKMTHSVLASLFIGASLVTSCSTETEELDALNSSSANELNSSAIEAEDYDAQSGIQISGNGTRVGYVQDGDWIRFDDFDYDGANSISIQASSGTSGGTIEIRTGSSGGDLLGTVSVSSTSGWASFETFTGSIDDDSSNSDLYLVFTGGSGYLFDVDSFEFSGSSSSSSSGNTDSTNLALAGSAEQSSTAYSGAASRAIDGNTSGIWGGNSVTHTNIEDSPWWQVRLDADTTIEEVIIWNRTNCCMDRLSNFDVFVYNTSGTQVYKTTITDTPNPSVTINTGGVTGNRVRIKLKSSDEPLSLAEVQVFGEATNGGGTTEETETSGTNTGDTPHDVLGLDRWKVTLPKDEGGDSDADEVFYYKADNDYSGDDALTDYSDEFFYVNDSGNVVFECPADFDLPKTSSGTSNTRTELREMPYRSGDEDGWDAGGSTVRELNMRVRVMQTSSTRKLAFAQIHDFEEDNWDDLIRIQIQSDDENATVGDTGKIYVMGDMAEGLDSEGVDGEDSDDRTILSNYTLGDWMDIRVTYNNDTIRIYLDGNEVKEYTGADCPSNYFKAGLYNQSMTSSSSGTGIVEIQSLSVTSNF